ncbi:Ribosomal protein S5 2-like protein [Glarea lozoyensis ATCC 20868]|uniref:Ribosomal protein S5 2-like protein n=1 Tax=Glarea lozoyensis (strain ATCC 20868 / MF5171) TaxID=1116229 RepID=S3DR55_GLAL2|nr:Ribosomal protein S5 2-like protein [Glarea lozoyensis ATCC 20868]EPE28948.1 Ribosomal protein S5 2-like protein [Glarea lozoyensis ATCC 20868]
MAAKDVQDLLRLLTTGRNKVPMLAAMGRVKALQTAGLMSITDVSNTDLKTLKTALSTDEKTAKSLLTACKAQLKNPTPSNKRSASDPLSPASKRLKSQFSLHDVPETPQELEASLALPTPSVDEEAISKCTIYTNRAPLVLAFAVQLLKHTMPEQPLSSRLSLAQAVVSANSRTKAVSLGIKERVKGEDSWGEGQPKVRVMGREVSVLKRSGYEWREEVEVDGGDVKAEEVGEGGVKEEAPTGSEATLKVESQSPTQVSSTNPTQASTTKWTVSSTITSKKSTFVARSITITSQTQATHALSTLLSDPTLNLSSASHNITAYRLLAPSGHINESCSDDGESGGGRHILKILQDSNLTNVLLVVTRWYGGIMLGPDRWRIMSDVSRDALSQRLRVAGVVRGEALWGLDLENSETSHTTSPLTGAGLPIHRPEGARAYLLKSFPSPPGPPDVKGKKKTVAQINGEKEENLGLLLGALEMLFVSWRGLGREELERRAWGWYVAVRPEVEGGVAGWGGKGDVRLSGILGLRRKIEG